ncbi:MAG TPA: hypothetical protein VIJ07_06305 [Dermatophilaceae bacterium]
MTSATAQSSAYDLAHRTRALYLLAHRLLGRARGEQRRRAWHWRRQYYPSLSGPLQGQGAPLEGRPAGGRSLTEAQRRIATDWTTAFR